MECLPSAFISFVDFLIHIPFYLFVVLKTLSSLLIMSAAFRHFVFSLSVSLHKLVLLNIIPLPFNAF
jgi:hypothetical protein